MASGQKLWEIDLRSGRTALLRRKLLPIVAQYRKHFESLEDVNEVTFERMTAKMADMDTTILMLLSEAKVKWLSDMADTVLERRKSESESC